MVILTIAVHLSKRSGFFAIQLGRLIRTYEYIMKVFRQKVPVHSTFMLRNSSLIQRFAENQVANRFLYPWLKHHNFMTGDEIFGVNGHYETKFEKNE